MASVTGVSTAGKYVAAVVTETELTGTDDTLTYDSAGVLVIRNSTGGTVNLTVHGSTSSGTKYCEGGGSVDLSVAVPISVTAGQVKSIRLGSIRDFLSGTISFTGGVAGVFAYTLK